MKQLALLILSICLSASTAFAQKTKTVEATYTYYAPKNVSLEDAERTALEQAQLKAIADAFGTIVSRSSSVHRKADNGRTNISVSSYGGSEVKGEWIETIGEPDYDISYEQGTLVVVCHVKGKAREIVTAQIDFKARVLRNGTGDRYEDDDFRDGDDLYLAFQSPMSGYLAVYLTDHDRQVFCLLPYRNQQEGAYPVQANRRYLFFHAKDAPQEERPYVDEYVMSCSRSSEFNQIYVIFSPNQFAKATDNSTNDLLPRKLDYEDFNKWLVKCRKQDEQMNLRMIPITVKK